MKVIYKYPLEITDNQSIRIPDRSQFLSVLNQNGNIVAYFLVDPNNQQVDVRIMIAGTGHQHSDNYFDGWRFLGSVPQYRSKFMWHIFCQPPMKGGL